MRGHARTDRERLELMVRSARRLAPRAMIVLKTGNAMCEEAFLASKRKQAMALGQGITYMSAFEGSLNEGNEVAAAAPPAHA